MAITCNISKKDRHIRTVIGILIIAAAFFEWRYQVLLILGVILILEGLVGWCSFALFYDKVKQWASKKK